jgi:hypothetical protein
MGVGRGNCELASNVIAALQRFRKLTRSRLRATMERAEPLFRANTSAFIRRFILILLSVTSSGAPSYSADPAIACFALGDVKFSLTRVDSGKKFALADSSRQFMKRLFPQDERRILSNIDLVIQAISTAELSHQTAKFFVVGDIFSGRGPVFVIADRCDSYCNATEIHFREGSAVVHRNIDVFPKLSIAAGKTENIEFSNVYLRTPNHISQWQTLRSVDWGVPGEILSTRYEEMALSDVASTVSACLR